MISGSAANHCLASQLASEDVTSAAKQTNRRHPGGQFPVHNSPTTTTAMTMMMMMVMMMEMMTYSLIER